MKMPLGRDKEIDSAKRQMTLKSHFLSFSKLKLQIQRGRKIVNLRVRLAFRYNFTPTRRMFDDSENSFLAFVQSSIIRLGRGRKSDF
jgi:hypothetical protein